MPAPQPTATSAASPRRTAASRGSAPISPRPSPQKSELSVRPAVPADIEALRAILTAAFAPYVPLIGRRPAPMDIDVAAAVERGAVHVAERQGGPGIEGFAVLGPLAQPRLLEVVAVAPSVQGHGVGGTLVEAVERVAAREGATAMRLYTNAAMAANVPLYEHLGYRVTDRRQEDGFARVFMEKPLRPAIALRPSVEGLYGRRRVHGHRVDPRYERFAVDLSQPFQARRLFARAVDGVRLEVGFGGGEHLIHHARAAPSLGLIGVEPFESGVMRAVRDLSSGEIDNVRLHMGDAREVLDWLPAGTLDRVDILYPDPWPKRKHWKRRFIGGPTLDRLARALSPTGTVRLASDIASYIEWTRAHVAAHPAFELAADSPEPWEGWPGTRYEAKARREGRGSRYLTLIRSTASPRQNLEGRVDPSSEDRGGPGDPRLVG